MRAYARGAAALGRLAHLANPPQDADADFAADDCALAAVG
jgi:hypothetical protein